ncbi:hypothetical protein N7510_007738 [Penicillium lagena]|uniref:uncharacterized protein n=1 Tax=Penicillium lagena TaxID=94218 RepID=UPI002541BF0B|nr:uncharacterized protein N7510_007738 [Penicillium lagena]KAJ5611019.1 hypothetical protein N7510_007738 [Penicillium lagena]
MSATATTSTFTTTLVGSPPAMTSVATRISEKQCPTCGGDGSEHSAEEAQRRIQELEGQVRDLMEHASITVGQLAEYEEQVTRLRSCANQAVTDTPRSSSETQAQQGRLATLTSLLPSYRRPSNNSSNTPAPTTPTAAVCPPPYTVQQSPASSESTSELQDALTREQSLRKAAESQLSQASTELEELTVQLFSQANEMVAQERKARVRLEERVAVLERRDVEKRSRLERLEKAMARVERLRALVNP